MFWFFAFSYQGDNHHAGNSDYVLLDWTKSGMSLNRIGGYPATVVGEQPEGGAEKIMAGAVLGSSGWEHLGDDDWYELDIYVDANELKININGEESPELSVSSSIAGVTSFEGKFCLFAFTDEDVRFADFSVDTV